MRAPQPKQVSCENLCSCGRTSMRDVRRYVNVVMHDVLLTQMVVHDGMT